MSTRRLAADVVAFGKPIGEDEAGTHSYVPPISVTKVAPRLA